MNFRRLMAAFQDICTIFWTPFITLDSITQQIAPAEFPPANFNKRLSSPLHPSTLEPVGRQNASCALSCWLRYSAVKIRNASNVNAKNRLLLYSSQFHKIFKKWWPRWEWFFPNTINRSALHFLEPLHIFSLLPALTFALFKNQL